VERKSLRAAFALALVTVAVLAGPSDLVLTPGERLELSADREFPPGAEFRVAVAPPSEAPVLTAMGFDGLIEPVGGRHFAGDQGRASGPFEPFHVWTMRALCHDGPSGRACEGYGIVRTLEDWRTVAPISDGASQYPDAAPDFSAVAALIVSVGRYDERCCSLTVTGASWSAGQLVVEADFESWPSCPTGPQAVDLAAAVLLDPAALSDAHHVEVRIHHFEVVCP
jgi:hypothetical protein